MHKEWDNIEKHLREDMNNPVRTIMSIWRYIGLIALAGMIVLAVVEGK